MKKLIILLLAVTLLMSCEKQIVVWNMKDIIAVSIIVFMGIFLIGLNLVNYIQKKHKKK